MPSFWSQEISCALCDLKGRTDDVIVRPHALRTRSAKVAGDDTFHTHILRSSEDVSLQGDHGGIHRADQDVDTFDHRLQLLVVVGDVTLADFDAGSAQAFGLGLRERSSAYQCRDTLAITFSMLCSG